MIKNMNIFYAQKKSIKKYPVELQNVLVTPLLMQFLMKLIF